MSNIYRDIQHKYNLRRGFESDPRRKISGILLRVVSFISHLQLATLFLFWLRWDPISTRIAANHTHSLGMYEIYQCWKQSILCVVPWHHLHGAETEHIGSEVFIPHRLYPSVIMQAYCCFLLLFFTILHGFQNVTGSVFADGDDVSLQFPISHFRPYFPRFLFLLFFILWIAKNSNKAFLKKNKSSRFRLFSGLRFLGLF